MEQFIEASLMDYLLGAVFYDYAFVSVANGAAQDVVSASGAGVFCALFFEAGVGIRVVGFEGEEPKLVYPCERCRT